MLEFSQVKFLLPTQPLINQTITVRINICFALIHLWCIQAKLQITSYIKLLKGDNKKFFKSILNLFRARDKRDYEINRNPTEEQLKDNKKGKKSIVLSIVSTIVYIISFFIIVASWQEHILLGLFVLFLVLILTPRIQLKAISLAKQQRATNGKGLFALFFAYLLPTIVLVGAVLFFALGGVYIFFK